MLRLFTIIHCTLVLAVSPVLATNEFPATSTTQAADSSTQKKALIRRPISSINTPATSVLAAPASQGTVSKIYLGPNPAVPSPTPAAPAPTPPPIPTLGKPGRLGPLSGFAPLTPPQLRPLSPKRMERERHQLVVYWSDMRPVDQDIKRMAAEFGLKRVDKEMLNELGGAIARITVEINSDLATLRQHLRDAFPHAVIDYNVRYYAEAGPRHYFPEKIGFDMVDGPALSVGIVDGEVARIPALAQAHIVSRSFLDKSDTPGAAAHATAIAALIIGNDENNHFRGIAPRARLINAAIMRQTGKQQHTNTFLLARALDWLLAQKAPIINLSLGGAGDDLMAKIFDKLHVRRVIIVAAAGNSGATAPPSYPAAYPGVLAITATNATNAIYANANQGNYIALAAPGEDLWVPTAGGGEYVSGTSFAAAVASATIARLLPLKPDWDTVKIRRHLCRSAQDLGEIGPDPIFGCGLIQFRTALNAAS